MALEDDGKFLEAEAEFILAEKPKEAILMYVHAQNWIHALRIAETYEPASVPEVLQAQAAQCFKDKQFSEFEVLLLRAQMPELIVQKYKASGKLHRNLIIKQSRTNNGSIDLQRCGWMHFGFVKITYLICIRLCNRNIVTHITTRLQM